MLVNGQPLTQLSLNDRGLAYGDGLFETILVRNHQPFLLAEHRQRLLRGCERLGLALDQAAFDAELQQVLVSAAASNAVLKIMLTRAAGGRGYRPGNNEANRIFTLHAIPDYSARQPEAGIVAFVCQQRLARQPALAGLKHLNRLEQVMASREWPDDEPMEWLMLDTAGLVIEGTRSNIFVARDQRLFTPGLQQCGVDGVLRAALLRHFGDEACVADLSLDQLQHADEVFFCNSVFGIWPVLTLRAAAARWQFTPGRFTQRARSCFDEALR
jgi:4-amino-4-deoxychorismate lyase